MCKPGYLDLESGYSRLPDGLLHVAAWTTMPGCKGAMVEWWFGFLETTEQHKRWHPKDNVWCECAGERGTGCIGGTLHVHEQIGGEPQKLKTHYRDRAEYLDASCFSAAGVTAAVCTRVGALEAIIRAGHLIHLCRDTPYGSEMRSRFRLGPAGRFRPSGSGSGSRVPRAALPRPDSRGPTQALPRRDDLPRGIPPGAPCEGDPVLRPTGRLSSSATAPVSNTMSE